MEELKKRTVEIFKELCQEWVRVIREGESSGGLDPLEMNSVIADKFAELDSAFLDAASRLHSSSTSKKGFFGGNKNG